MNLDSDLASELAANLGCDIASFPQLYLGLPLSPTRLRVQDYSALVSSFDRYLAGWRAKLLTAGGKLVLTNAVLGSLALYHMCSLPLPPTVRETLDGRRRAFLWTGTDKCYGSQCLIA
ncbi:unnamed protein product [Urochloa humidicola]